MHFSDKGDYLTELRFFIPDNEEDKEEDKNEQSENAGEGENDEEEKVKTGEEGKSKVSPTLTQIFKFSPLRNLPLRI